MPTELPGPILASFHLSPFPSILLPKKHFWEVIPGVSALYAVSQTSLEKQPVVWDSPNNAEVEGINQLPETVKTCCLLVQVSTEVLISLVTRPRGRNMGLNYKPAGNWLQSLPLFQHVLENLFSRFLCHIITSAVLMRQKPTKLHIMQ